MLENTQKDHAVVKNPGLIQPDLSSPGFLSTKAVFDDGDPDTDDRDVTQATDALDAVSERVTPVGVGKQKDLRSRLDDHLDSGKDSPRKVWSDVSKRELTKIIKKDSALKSKVSAIFTENLGDELKSWGKMVKKGRPDRTSLLQSDTKIANIIASYDRQLENLARNADIKNSGAITGMREALRAIAMSMSETTKYINKKGLWKS